MCNAAVEAPATLPAVAPTNAPVVTNIMAQARQVIETSTPAMAPPVAPALLATRAFFPMPVASTPSVGRVGANRGAMRLAQLPEHCPGDLVDTLAEALIEIDASVCQPVRNWKLRGLVDIASFVVSAYLR
jgi:hypothetical protein